ncbi:MAG: ABC transporter substrate-binding protein [Cyanosarcina radialis HA8281-LM2]|nr:ABC transporter substrate-binding protein [Cyanosarcina radialis HA8281-LM2]
MQIYCTRPSCPKPANSFGDLDDTSILKTVSQKYCISCGMPLILDGRYLPLQLLRRGGFGAAFLACDRRTPTFRRCVVKQFQPHPSLSAEQLDTATRLFHREAEVLEDLGNHPKIPQFFAFLEFTAPPWNAPLPQKFFYLVQEYIDGRNLQQEVEEKGPLSEAETVKVLKEVLEILEFVHNRGSIHRDIKPSNIMRDRDGSLYLIDFGAVKQVTITGSGNPSASTVQPFQSLTGIFTPEYAPPEQRQCRAVFPSSDLYALAVTCVHLLTGKPPQYLFDTYANRWNWRSEAQVNDRLANILDRMLLENPHERFISAREVLETLAASSLASLPPQPNSFGQQTATKLPLPRKKILAGIVGAGVLALGILGTVVGLRSCQTGVDPIADRVSVGDRVLIENENPNQTEEFTNLKAAGIQSFKQGNFPEAVKQFELALQKNPNAPETRIYLNNAKIGNDKAYVIAATVPITPDSNYRALEMLRGFAQAQTEVNDGGGINNLKLKLEIIDDDDDPKTAERIANQLVKRSEILAVIGHNSSPVSMAAAKIYNAEKMVFITPISITNQLTAADRPYIFRTNIKGELAAQQLASYMLNNFQRKKAAIFFVRGIPYSEDLRAQFANKLASQGGEVVDSIDLSSTNFSPDRSLQTVSDKGAEVVVLFPTYKYRGQAWNVLQVKQDKYPQLNALGDIATLYSFDTLQNARSAAVGMVLVVSWHIADPVSASNFSIDSKNLWGAPVNWATATSYNGMQALTDAIKRDSNPTRESVKDALIAGSFNGTSGNFQFFNGESTEKSTLVQVCKTPPDYPFSSNTGYDFVPVGSIGAPANCLGFQQPIRQ